MTNTRKYTKILLQMMDDGIISPETIVVAALNFMSESEVEEMMRINDFFVEDETDE